MLLIISKKYSKFIEKILFPILFCLVIKKENSNEIVLSKIIIIFIDLIKIYNVDAWKYIEIGLICMEKLIIFFNDIFNTSFNDRLNNKKFIQLIEILLLFISDLTENAKNYNGEEYQKIIERYFGKIFIYINKIFQNNRIRFNN